MPTLNLVEALLPAVAIALVIRLDARLVGPYFSTVELIAGMEGLDAPLFYSNARLRFAVMRRFLWPVGGSAIAGLIWQDRPVARGIVIGGLSIGLLLWPAAFHGLPWGVARNDWHLVPMYLSLVAAFCLGGALGGWASEYVRSEAQKRGYAEFLRTLLLPAIGLWVLKFLFTSSLEAIRHKRNEAANE